MNKLTGTCWGAGQRVLKKLYVGSIRPVLDYGMTSSCTAAKLNTKKTSRIQNQAMRMVTGAMCSIPISVLETATGLRSLEDRNSIEVLIQAAQFKRLTDHPMHSRMSKPTEGRLKRSSFIHHSMSLERQQPELLDHMREPIQAHTAVPCWESQKFPIIFMRIPGIERKAIQSDPERSMKTKCNYLNG